MENKGFPRPFAGSYGVMLTIAILAISPFIVITTASGLYRPQVAYDLGASLTGLSVISGIATAGYAFGAFLGGDLNQRFRQRNVFIVGELLFILGCGLAAGARGVVMFGAGSVLGGLATGILLVAALPPVIQRFPPARMPITAAVVNIGFFGAVTIGPMVGGAVAFGEVWRWFYGGLAAIAAANLLTALFAIPDQEPFNPGMPFDRSAIFLALVATVLPFWASGELASIGFSSYFFMVPLAVGVTCFIALLIIQYYKMEPLSPVKPMWHTYPVLGTLAAMIGGGVFITLSELVQRYQIEVAGRSPLEAGLSFWPQVVGVLVTATLLGLLLRTRFLPILTLCGMFLLIAAGAVLLVALGPESSDALRLGAIAMLGLGAGATVSPGLFMAAFSLPSKSVGRTFALVELVRSEADFILAPVMVQVAQFTSPGKGLALSGINQAILITVLIAGGTTVLGITLYLASAGPNLPQVNLKGWLKESKPAFQSPAFGAAARGE